jgi:hypothetical protein
MFPNFYLLAGSLLFLYDNNARLGWIFALMAAQEK